MRRRALSILTGLVSTATVASGCSASAAGIATSTTTGRGPARIEHRAPAMFYVSLGDSYAAGYQPTADHSGHTDTNGFAYEVPALAAKKGYDLKLVNFGCSGATTESILTSRGCALPGPYAPPYPHESQAAAAEGFIRRHRGRIGLITVSIGGNDIIHCAREAVLTSCMGSEVSVLGRNLGELLKGLRTAAGRSVPIVGTTYPDVILGLDLSRRPALRSLATLSVLAFRLVVNPELKRAYEAAGGRFADVTAATGAYGSFARTVVLAPYGRIPLPVAKVCELTFFCQDGDIHPRTAGYRVVAGLVVGELPRRN